MSQTYRIAPEDAGQRLDIWLTTTYPGVSRSKLQKVIKQGEISINGQTIKPKYELKEDDVVKVPDIESTASASPAAAIKPHIIFENEQVVVIDKPAGAVMHPGEGQAGGTVADWFASRYPDSATVGEDSQRPGIIHRLDKDTSGVVILAKTHAAYTHLKNQFQKRYAKKDYLALVYGVPRDASGRITRPLRRSPKNPVRRTVDSQGKRAITEWRKEITYNTAYSLLRCFPLTGRTHQIRVHLHWRGYPIVGDSLYTFKRQKQPTHVTRHLLHAASLTLQLPTKETKTFTTPLPEDFKQVLHALEESEETQVIHAVPELV